MALNRFTTKIISRETKNSQQCREYSTPRADYSHEWMRSREEFITLLPNLELLDGANNL
jgi:hypothetical protein